MFTRMKKFTETHDKLKAALNRIDELCPKIESPSLIEGFNFGPGSDDMRFYAGPGAIIYYESGLLCKTGAEFRSCGTDKFGRIIWRPV